MSRLICFGIVFMANVIFAQLTVKHLLSNNKANHTFSASPAHLRFLISTDVQIIFVCQLTNLWTSASHPPLLSQLICQLTNLGQYQNICCTKPATQHAKHWYLQCCFQYPRVGVELLKPLTVFNAHKSKRIIRCTPKQE